MVNEEQVEGRNVLNARGIEWIYLALGHLKPGVTPAQAIADLNSIAYYFQKPTPKSIAGLILLAAYAKQSKLTLS